MALQAGNTRSNPVGNKWFQALRTHLNVYEHRKTLVGTLVGFALYCRWLGHSGGEASLPS